MAQAFPFLPGFAAFLDGDSLFEFPVNDPEVALTREMFLTKSANRTLRIDHYNKDNKNKETLYVNEQFMRDLSSQMNHLVNRAVRSRNGALVARRIDLYPILQLCKHPMAGVEDVDWDDARNKMYPFQQNIKNIIGVLELAHMYDIGKMYLIGYGLLERTETRYLARQSIAILAKLDRLTTNNAPHAIMLKIRAAIGGIDLNDKAGIATIMPDIPFNSRDIVCKLYEEARLAHLHPRINPVPSAQVAGAAHANMAGGSA